jgi:transposase
MKKKASGKLSVSADELRQIKARVRERKLEDSDYELIVAILETVEFLRDAVQKKTIAVKRLLGMVFGVRTEKTRKVLPGGGGKPPAGSSTPSEQQNRKRKGHGRNGVEQYWGADRIVIAHQSLKIGDSCPQCPKGKLYQTNRPGVLVHFQGSPPVIATVYECQSLRCGSCGAVFTAEASREVSGKKYDESAGSSIAVLKYGHGFPFHRLEHLQAHLGIPLPASTQWELVAQKASSILPVYECLMEQAAQGELLHNDDTAMKILQYLGKRAEKYEDPDSDKAARTGIFTTGIISLVEGHRIALFFTGKNHAGENMARVLEKRQEGRPPPLQMCDALSRNLPQKFKVILCNCLAHARRRFVELVEVFPSETEFVLESLKKVYFHDEQAKQQGMRAKQRLEHHQKYSRPVMEDLHAWLHKQFDEKKVEPNSSMGEAISYMISHWEPLTRFLRVPGAPLDNNIAERALKRAILHRKNSLFYKTQRGAFVGDLYMSLIYTCMLCGSNPVEYLTELERHASELVENPDQWLPWNYPGATTAGQPVPG